MDILGRGILMTSRMNTAVSAAASPQQTPGSGTQWTTPALERNTESPGSGS
ncbi:MAG: hypothetical protein Ct9H300mP9_5100 [Candidatus Neomarinimicrobiota bacterium]|nr:MAG: hypothetical protein Ct9H300mP9_5100 [Candidatus Neomarinimicrobiota bacterium]